MNGEGIWRELGKADSVLLTIRLLGSPALEREGVAIPLPRTRKALLLLATLALHAGRGVDRKLLAETLWPESDPVTGASSLRQALAILRKTLGAAADCLAMDGNQAIRLEPERAYCDVIAFDDALRRGDIDAAKALYTGPFLEGFTDDWVLAEREKREREFLRLTQEPAPSKLPAFLTPFLGRKTELDRVRALLGRDGIRLVSVLGMGGLGKTRLAIEVLTSSPEATLLDLTILPPNAQAPRLWQMLAETLELATLTEAAVCEALREREAILLFDNAEHVLRAASQVVHAVLSRCPRVKALVTSREPLQLPGEVLFRLSPLSDEDSQALFAQKAELALPGIELPESAVRSVCRKLEGLPLALELAAAHLRSMPVEELETRLADRFRLLRSGQRHADRHQTLQATLDGSWEQLCPQEKSLLSALSVLVGSWPRSLAQAVAFSPGTEEIEVLESLTRLVDASWLQVSSGRYSLLETLREYLVPRQRPEDRERLVALAEETIPWRAGESETVWLARLDTLRDSLVVALGYAAPENALTLAAELVDFFVYRGRLAEGEEIFAKLLPQATPDHPARARALFGWAMLLQGQDRPEEADVLLVESEAICKAQGQDALRARVVSQRGISARNLGDLLSAHALFLRAYELARKVPNTSTGTPLLRLALVEHDLGNLDAARTHLEEVVRICDAPDRETTLAVALAKLGAVERDAGRLALAAERFEAALELHRALGYHIERGNTALALGSLRADAGHLPEAHILWEEAHAAFESARSAEGMARVRNLVLPPSPQ